MSSTPRANGKSTVAPKYQSFMQGSFAINNDRDWAQIDGELLRDAVVHTISDGDAVMFGMTADGGALLVCVMTGDNKHKRYSGTVDELETLLRALRDV